jgi:hypothetical protein
VTEADVWAETSSVALLQPAPVVANANMPTAMAEPEIGNVVRLMTSLLPRWFPCVRERRIRSFEARDAGEKRFVNENDETVAYGDARTSPS